MNRAVALLAVTLSCGLSAAAQAASVSNRVSGILPQFAAVREKQAWELSTRMGIPFTDELSAFFAAGIAGNGNYVTNAFGLRRDSSGKEVYYRLTNVLWQSVLETLGAYEIWDEWGNDDALLRAFVDPILASMPDQSIYFGGTDAGRFVVTAVSAVRNRPIVYCLTQNALADNRYTEHLSAVLGKTIWLPTPRDAGTAFQRYLSEVDAGKRKANAQITTAGGKITVTGALGVMEIAGIIAEMIFERNRDSHAIFVEESFVLEWMYPYLTPTGHIMRLNSLRLDSLPPAVVTADREYWADLEKKLNGIPSFRRTKAAQLAFAKCRTAIAGIYAFRGMPKEAESSFRQAIRLCPASPDANFRLADHFESIGDNAQSIAVLAEYLRTDLSPDHAERAKKRLDDLRAR